MAQKGKWYFLQLCQAIAQKDNIFISFLFFFLSKKKKIAYREARKKLAKHITVMARSILLLWFVHRKAIEFHLSANKNKESEIRTEIHLYLKKFERRINIKQRKHII